MGNQIVCPTCREIPKNKDTVLEAIYEHGYYEPRHIPPELVFTCFNEQCKDCDKDFSFLVSVNIVLTAK